MILNLMHDHVTVMMNFDLLKLYFFTFRLNLHDDMMMLKDVMLAHECYSKLYLNLIIIF